jgi:hypothetical protein
MQPDPPLCPQAPSYQQCSDSIAGGGATLSLRPAGWFESYDGMLNSNCSCTSVVFGTVLGSLLTSTRFDPSPVHQNRPTTRRSAASKSCGTGSIVRAALCTGRRPDVPAGLDGDRRHDRAGQRPRGLRLRLPKPAEPEPSWRRCLRSTATG